MPAEKPKPALADQDRLSVRLNAYHETFGDSPTGIELKFGHLLEKKDGAYIRPKLVVKPAGVPIDNGWVENPGLVIIEHKAKTYQLNPTPEQKKLDEDARLFLVAGVFKFPIRPGRFTLFEVESLEQLAELTLSSNQEVLASIIVVSR